MNGKLFYPTWLFLFCFFVAGLTTSCHPMHRAVNRNYEKYWTKLIDSDVRIIRQGDTLRMILPTDAFFHTNTAQLRDREIPTLKTIAKLITAYNNCNSPILITGNTDNIPPEAARMGLSKELGEAIAAFLWANGIDNHRIHVIGYGDTKPIASNSSPLGSAFNRRVEIRMNLFHEPDANILSGFKDRN